MPCPFKKEKNSLGKPGPKTKKKKIIKTGAERKHLHSQNQFIKQLGESWRSHTAIPDGFLGASGATSIIILSLDTAPGAITAKEESSHKVRKGNLIRTFEP